VFLKKINVKKAGCYRGKKIYLHCLQRPKRSRETDKTMSESFGGFRKPTKVYFSPHTGIRSQQAYIRRKSIGKLYNTAPPPTRNDADTNGKKICTLGGRVQKTQQAATATHHMLTVVEKTFSNFDRFSADNFHRNL
jgi:hypothetical protein